MLTPDSTSTFHSIQTLTPRTSYHCVSHIIKLYWDGAATGFKAEVQEERSNDRKDDEVRLWRLCNDGLKQSHQNNYPVPPLLAEQVSERIQSSAVIAPLCMEFFGSALSQHAVE